MDSIKSMPASAVESRLLSSRRRTRVILIRRRETLPDRKTFAVRTAIPNRERITLLRSIRTRYSPTATVFIASGASEFTNTPAMEAFIASRA